MRRCISGAIIALVSALALQGCATSEDNRKLGAGLAVLLGAAAGAYAVRHNGGGYSVPTDSEWDWDEFYNSQGALVWACRGVQTGQFADEWHCAAKIQMDTRWPGK